ncbi:hypothetical protein [Streptomyces sp. NPDC049813]|uniref:hypothetical protein n=1 Tax=Streptomyces sp. NPDC049813 TaxID=3365597 RepID=UPI0037B15779
MSVADDARPPAPAHSAAHRGAGPAPDGGTLVSDGGGRVGARVPKAPVTADGSAAATDSASPSASGSRGTPPAGRTRPPKAPPTRSTPTVRPTPPRTTPPPPPTPPKETPTPTPDPSPTTAEPSSSAHEQQAAAHRVLGEPAPQAGSPA